MAMLIIGSLYSIVDGLFVSNYVGLTPFAGLNIAWPAIMVVGALGLMIGSGGSAIVSRMLGQRDLDKACETFTSLIAFTMLLSLGFGIPMFILMPRIVVLLGADGAELVRAATTYGRVFAAGMPAFMLQMAFQSFYMAAEKPELGTRLSLACGLTNIVLDTLFIIVLKMGLFGAALASIMASCVGEFFPVWYFLRKRGTRQLRLTRIRFNRGVLVHTCTNGSSEYIGNIAFSIVSMCYNHQLMLFYGQAGVAAYSVIMYIGYIFAAVFIGYNLTVSPVVAFNYGADNRQELHSLLFKSARILLGLGLLLTLTAEVAAGPCRQAFRRLRCRYGVADRQGAADLYAEFPFLRVEPFRFGLVYRARERADIRRPGVLKVHSLRDGLRFHPSGHLRGGGNLVFCDNSRSAFPCDVRRPCGALQGPVRVLEFPGRLDVGRHPPVAARGEGYGADLRTVRYA